MDAEIINTEQEHYSGDIKVFNSIKTGNKIRFQKMSLIGKIKQIGAEKYGALCNELKELYTAITRARKKLIIYDENPNKAQKIKNLWKSLNLLELVCEEDFYFDNESEV